MTTCTRLRSSSVVVCFASAIFSSFSFGIAAESNESPLLVALKGVENISKEPSVGGIIGKTPEEVVARVIGLRPDWLKWVPESAQHDVTVALSPGQDAVSKKPNWQLTVVGGGVGRKEYHVAVLGAAEPHLARDLDQRYIVSKLANVQSNDFPVKFLMNGKSGQERQTLRVGDSIEFAFETPTDGFLNIVNVSPAGDLMPLFPQHFDSDNRVYAGKSTPILGTKVKENGVFGCEYVKAIFTKTPLRIVDHLTKSRDLGGSEEPQTKDVETVTGAIKTAKQIATVDIYFETVK